MWDPSSGSVCASWSDSVPTSCSGFVQSAPRRDGGGRAHVECSMGIVGCVLVNESGTVESRLVHLSRGIADVSSAMIPLRRQRQRWFRYWSDNRSVANGPASLLGGDLDAPAILAGVLLASAWVKVGGYMVAMNAQPLPVRCFGIALYLSCARLLGGGAASMINVSRF